eukprot:TRINITY_DN649_c2_g1_i1.p1 TRINITY_DN649_c2_g1~~TRINITY_DN649_c2_g1_i1.p1  ORF type:complete len:715 (+),score=103.80 TRINITY_DN649_c2_g1_i1:212-2146(+)
MQRLMEGWSLRSKVFGGALVRPEETCPAAPGAPDVHHHDHEYPPVPAGMATLDDDPSHSGNSLQQQSPAPVYHRVVWLAAVYLHKMLLAGHTFNEKRLEATVAACLLVALKVQTPMKIQVGMTSVIQMVTGDATDAILKNLKLRDQVIRQEEHLVNTVGELGLASYVPMDLVANAVARLAGATGTGNEYTAAVRVAIAARRARITDVAVWLCQEAFYTPLIATCDADEIARAMVWMAWRMTCTTDGEIAVEPVVLDALSVSASIAPALSPQAVSPLGLVEFGLLTHGDMLYAPLPLSDPDAPLNYVHLGSLRVLGTNTERTIQFEATGRHPPVASLFDLIDCHPSLSAHLGPAGAFTYVRQLRASQGAAAAERELSKLVTVIRGHGKDDYFSIAHLADGWALGKRVRALGPLHECVGTGGKVPQASPGVALCDVSCGYECLYWSVRRLAATGYAERLRQLRGHAPSAGSDALQHVLRHLRTAAERDSELAHGLASLADAQNCALASGKTPTAPHVEILAPHGAPLRAAPDVGARVLEIVPKGAWLLVVGGTPSGPWVEVMHEASAPGARGQHGYILMINLPHLVTAVFRSAQADNPPLPFEQGQPYHQADREVSPDRDPRHWNARPGPERDPRDRRPEPSHERH